MSNKNKIVSDIIKFEKLIITFRPDVNKDGVEVIFYADPDGSRGSLQIGDKRVVITTDNKTTIYCLSDIFTMEAQEYTAPTVKKEVETAVKKLVETVVDELEPTVKKEIVVETTVKKEVVVEPVAQPMSDNYIDMSKMLENALNTLKNDKPQNLATKINEINTKIISLGFNTAMNVPKEKEKEFGEFLENI